MTRTDILRVVRTAVGEVLGVAPEAVGETDDLVDTHNVDSLELMEIGVRVERALGVRVEVERVREMRTPADVVAYLRTLTPSGTPEEVTG
ncbi:acyl carrier protein [Streptomyces griseoaurantiacus]|jgi:acyl carrier protein|uniref:acyl carrier protein n=1 Tax=Streptomyces griseoaurantiacus TaxID=68213 RepID=UPI00345FB535